MKSIPKLVDAILVAWSKCLMPPYGSGEYSSSIDGATDCNRFVNEVCNRFGYTKFNGLLANQMFDLFLNNGDWLEIQGEIAQYHANSGALVVASYQNPSGHGHVCMVRPGIAETSGKWEVITPSVPKVANVGEPETCKLDIKASYAFGPYKRPKYFVLKSMI